jgi:hypothetical protein
MKHDKRDSMILLIIESRIEWVQVLTSAFETWQCDWFGHFATFLVFLAG